jgi:hypothetical protein
VSTNQRIGFGKKIRWDWFLLALRLRAKEVSFEDAREELEHLIAETNAGKVAIAKSMSVLRQVIFLPTPSSQKYSEVGFDLFRRHGDQVALPVIWGLSISGYSFFASCADTIGRLLKLHAEFTAAEMQRRLTEREGDRAFVIRIARFNLSSMLDWGLLEYNAGAKRYQRGKVTSLHDPEIVGWLAEGVLLASNKTSMPQSQLFASNLLFPFDTKPIAVTQLARINPRLQVIRQSLNEQLVALTENSSG